MGLPTCWAGPMSFGSSGGSAYERHRAGFVRDRTDVALLAEPDPTRPPADVNLKCQPARLQVEDLHQPRTRKRYVGLIVIRRHSDAERLAGERDRCRRLS